MRQRRLANGSWLGNLILRLVTRFEFAVLCH